MSAFDAIERRLGPLLPLDAAGGAALAMILVAIPILPKAGPYATGAVAVLAILAVASREVRRHPGIWALIGAVHAFLLARDWYRLDNHDFLILYAVLALAVAFTTEDPEASFRTQARWLVGLAFALATGWKLFSGEFIDGTFFTHAQLVDPRFSRVAELVSGLDAATAEAAREAIAAAVREPVAAAVTIPTDQVRGLAALFTGWGVALEGGIAVTMLGPDRPRWRAARSLLLLVFMGTTYLVVPVVRFGLLLAALGIGQSEGRWRTAFWWSIPALVAWGPIWQALQ